MTERSLPIEIDTRACGMAITTNGEYLVSAGAQVEVWRVKDGQRVATMGVDARCVAVSKDGRWIAAGTMFGEVSVWDTTKYKRVFRARKSEYGIHTVDFSPDSTRVLAMEDHIAVFWDIANRKQIQAFRTRRTVKSAKYHSLLGSRRIAVTTKDSVQVWDGDNDRMLTDIAIQPGPENGLLWFNNHLLVASWDKITEFDASTGSQVSEWPVPRGDENSFIALSQFQEFIAYSAKDTVTFWDTSAHTQLGSIQHPQNIRSIALSPDDEFLAIAGADGKITIMYLSRITEPDIQIDDVVLDSWKHDQLENTEALLTAAIRLSENSSHHALASRALVRSRLQRWDVALADAQKAIDIHRSVIGYIAKSMAHLGMGERRKAYQACDIAFDRFRASDGNFILLIRAIIVFMAGEHRDAISRMDCLIATVRLNSVCYVVQAYMYLLLGNSQMKSSDCETAIQSFERARAQTRHRMSQIHHVISLIFGWKFDNFDVAIEQGLCEALLGAGRTKDAVEMRSTLGEGTLEEGLGERFSKKLEQLGDTAMSAQRYDEAILHYSSILSIDLPFPNDILIKRHKAYMATESWNQAADDAKQMITLDPSSPSGYQLNHAALHKAGDYDNAVVAFGLMLSKMAQSPDPNVQRQRDRYINPLNTQAEIRKHVQRIINKSPRVLINTATGRLHNRAQRASAFGALSIFNELVSSMATRIDHARIEHEVRQYFRYVMLSHKWEDNEPLFQQVIHTAVYDLDQSPTHLKLQRFCEIVRDFGINWAWSDTCCIDRLDNTVLKEALIDMFKWYEGSEMTIIFLCDVFSSSWRGVLAKSIWNTRGWTLQEYVASKVVRFYTEDWMLYMNLDINNHKHSPEIISEMEEATGVSSQALMALRPGLDDIWEKLCLASTRKTFHVEDTAYSLLGIFSASLDITYGEGDRALSRLLAQLLTSSRDTSILAWTGKSGNFNSCLPASITVFNKSLTSLIPAITNDELEKITAGMRTSSLNLSLVMKLYDRLHELPVPSFSTQRMKLPCLMFKLGPLSVNESESGCIFHTMADALGVIEITTTEALSELDSLILAYPWIDFLLDRQPVGGVNERKGADIQSSSIGELSSFLSPSTTPSATPQIQGELLGRPVTHPPHAAALPAPSSATQMDKQKQALRLVARLRQPWGALLLTPTRQNVEEYKRVAAESLIMVQVKDITSALLNKLIDGVRVLALL